MELTTRAKHVLRMADFDPAIIRKWIKQDFAGMHNVGVHTAGNLKLWLKQNPRKPRSLRPKRPSRRDELARLFVVVLAEIGWIAPPTTIDKLVGAATELLSKKKPRKRK